MSKKDQLDYETMVQSALRTVVRDALLSVAAKGFPGNHHFYISFATDHPGVELPDYLKEQYPEEITIVLQHEFWDLEVSEGGFSVTLCFDEAHERLTAPFEAITSFVDPSVKFGLQFTPTYDLPAENSQKGKEKAPLGEDKTEKGSNVVTLDTFRKK